jgi:hypothetical protein
MPLQVVQASFFSSLFVGDQAYADASANTVTPPDTSDSQNLQSLPLLTADVSSDSVLNSDDTSNNQIDPNANVNIVADNAILPATGPMGVSDGTDGSDSSSNNTKEIPFLK